jgi:hypothetical protein
MFLTAQQLEFLTGSPQRMLQHAELDRLKVPYHVNRRGQTVVLEAAVRAILGSLAGSLPVAAGTPISQTGVRPYA